jgi:hypothetical protein
MKIVARRWEPRQARLSARQGTEGKRVGFRRRIWEPCCGAGAISTVLATHGYDSTDIANCGFGTPAVDFLFCWSVRDECHSIIINPPSGEAASEQDNRDGRKTV